MIAIYRGEDTDFAGAEPIQIKLDTALDLTGYTAQILFGSVVKDFGPEEVATKVLKLSFSAAESSGFFPGRGFATVKVYDTEGRTAILKRFVIDVRFRKCDNAFVDAVDLAESVQGFLNIREAAEKVAMLNEDDSPADVKETINMLLAAARERTEFSPIPDCELRKLRPESIKLFNECMRNLCVLSMNIDMLEEEADLKAVKDTINEIVAILGHLRDDSLDRIDFSEIEDPAASVNSIRSWAFKVNEMLRRLLAGKEINQESES